MYRSVLQLSNTAQTNSQTSGQASGRAPGQSPAGAGPRRKTVALAAALAVLACTHATAQDGAPAATDDARTAPPAGPGARTEVVTVTATRRREPVRDVPLRVETLSAETLERSGAASLTDYVGSLPGVHVATDGGPGRGQVEIRGVGVGSQNAPTVGIYVDDVAFGSSTSFVGEAVAALDLSLLDLHHVELLRGPQGTLYGAGAMGGLLKYVTNDPDANRFSGKAGVAVRQSRRGALGHTENAVVNVPLSEGVAAMRFAAFNEHDGGYIRSVGRVTGDHVNDGDTRGARLSFLFDPSRDLRVRVTATQQNIERAGTGVMQYDIATGRPRYGDLTHWLYRDEPYTIKTGLLSGDVEYNLGWARLNVIGSAQRFRARTMLDATDIVGSDGLNYGALDNNTRLDKRTAEVRLTSGRGPFEWLVGYYHNKETGLRDQRLYAQLPDGTESDFVRSAQPSRFIENAFYGDLTWNPAPQWSFTVGARAARNRQVYGTLTNGVKDFESGGKDSSKTYLATARYSIDKVSSVYFRAASGYRPGGPNPPALDQNGQVVPGAPLQFEPDKLWSYEVGYKADLLDRRLAIEAALFDIRWDKLQQPIAVGATTLTGNAGKAESKGLEVALRWKVDDHFTLEGNLAYTDAKLTEDAPALGPSGARLPNSARLSSSVTGRYGFDVGGHAAYAGLTLRQVGQRNAGFDAPGTSVPNFRLPGYAMADLQAGIEVDGWQVGAFVRNLADKRAFSSADTALTAFAGPLRVTPTQPRTVGMNLSREF
ncbi:outer membrane receptor protein involved in Fe transport [Pseudoduganella flava]|uniref:Outer membrane receptor protein involved in Fe transport n=1 Tax=Pseudoduganella flava TaxID=871742 RepID=A0A562Q3F3_9BURK|nr:TonB-dependent receptor [Pseudoduganella flava]QGZ41323.1 TonB-dependent receptor [Pseudoduganella flava]TWI51267.1 outer membrane receptor protein involved in Fe transport [Pseudoduganella flava]